MRILVLSDLPEFVTGGAEKQAANLIEAWLDAGHDVACFGRRMGAEAVWIGRHYIPVRRIHTIQWLGRWMRAASYFVSLSILLLRHRRRFDVIYTRFLGEAAATAAVLKRLGLLRAILVSTPANTGGRGDANFLLTVPFQNLLVRLLDRQCGAINLIAPAMADELRNVGFSGRNFTFIPNGVAVRTAPLSGDQRNNRFIAVGRVAKQKGYDVLLEALSHIDKHPTPCVVRIAGDGPERDVLFSLATQLQVSDAIVWLGELDHPSVLNELDHALVFLLPSRYEGLSNAGLEAMERGLAVIATRCGGLDRYIQADMGWIVEPGDAPALARALGAAISAAPDTLAEMGARCRTLVLQQFDIRIVATRYLELFRQLAERRPGRVRP